jgi:hypothetical protein
MRGRPPSLSLLPHARVRLLGALAPLRRGGKVAGECVVGFDGNDLAVLLPDLLEQGEHELAPLGGSGSASQKRVKSSRT